MVDQLNPAMAHLLNQSQKRVDTDSKRCWMIKLALSGAEYFLAHEGEGGSFGPTEIGMKFIDVYSVDQTGQPALHPILIVVGTGFIMDYVLKPSWWDKRPRTGDNKQLVI